MSKLSPTQKQIAKLTADGLRSEAIGAELGISAANVRKQISHILKKKGFKSALEISAWVWGKRLKKNITIVTSEQQTS